MNARPGKTDDVLLFAPSRATGEILRRRINGELSNSLKHILSACVGHVPMSASAVEILLERVRAGRETPYMYALHFELLAAIQDDRLDEIGTLIDRILSLPAADAGVLLTSLRPDEFPWDGGVVARYFAAEADAPFTYGPPAAETVGPRHAEIDAAIALLRSAAPGLAAEFEEVETTVVVSTGVAKEGASPVAPFQGASAMRAFGAIIMDATPDVTIVDTCVSLAHEEAHAVLFALSPKNGVVTNPDDERYTSPLRDDPRPLEGILHATFVLARILYVLEKLRDSGQLSVTDQRRLDAQVVESVGLFHDGAATLDRHADMTTEGRHAMALAETYVANAFPEWAKGAPVE